MAVCDCVQLAVLRKGLDLHGKRIAPALKGMQTNLEEKLELMVFEVFPERRKKVSHELLDHGCPHPSLLPPSLPPSLLCVQPVRSHTVKNVPLPPIPQPETV